jgi:hypothetical protein
MSEILQSPFTLGVCLLVLVAWVLLVVAIFWPTKPDGKPITHGKDDNHVCL